MASIDTSQLRLLAEEWRKQAALIEERWPEGGVPFGGTTGEVQASIIRGCASGLWRIAMKAEGVPDPCEVLDRSEPWDPLALRGLFQLLCATHDGAKPS